MANQSLKTLKGFRDFLPADMVIRKEVVRRLSAVFEKYGFSELATPALEYREVLTGKYGEEAEKLMYLFQDPGEREVGLKYDLTVPLARVIANNPNLPLPFKRYQIQPVWRAENTQKGRYRELYQCDIDIVGTSSPESDAEILAVISDSVLALGLKNFIINVNSRTVLFSIMKNAGVTESQWLSVIQSLDKLDKKSADEVKVELSEKGISDEQIARVFESLDRAEPDENLTQVIKSAQEMGAQNIVFNPTISRGLDYYTGTIFETVVTDFKIGSITGGGRYDNLLKTLGGPDLPAVGTAIGMERVIDVIVDQNLWGEMKSVVSQVLVTVFDDTLRRQSVEAVTYLRKNGINAEMYLDSAKLEKQFKYADSNNIPYVIVIGTQEASSGSVLLKNMKNGEQTETTLEKAVRALQYAHE